MNYFESLYPASDALTKQVQRAIKSLNMPKDEFGYFIPNKTADQLSEKANASVHSMEDYQPVLLKADPALASYLLSVIDSSPVLEGKYITAHTTVNGILLYTKNPSQLEILINSLIVR